MIRAGALLAALALCCVPEAVSAAPRHAVAPAAQKDVDRLIAVLVADGPMADLAIRAFDHQLETGSDAATRALYVRNPGMREAVAKALRPAMLKVLKRALPDLRKQIAAILVADLTPVELREAADFFTSPTGRKVYDQALRSIGDKPGQSEEQARAAATAAVMRNLAPEDYGPMMKFGVSSASRKMSTVNPKVSAASRAWANALIEKNQKKMYGTARRAADRFAARAKRSRK